MNNFVEIYTNVVVIQPLNTADPDFKGAAKDSIGGFPTEMVFYDSFSLTRWTDSAVLLKARIEHFFTM